ncbi:carboxypeptidase regulatory-like domain-containing protein [Hymenobacter sediminis]|uniref:carboxypeptidase-like regulatory domain-containing protein n=1 Tax=Hymenobacter sediminis TaxID=2218621 RepID=UPI000F5011AF|nr:carboxypeptidase-like regulatory domain-containing protein [Hymenobacter sediminis]RPD43891.1 carboxypeptidase regulatory-like domain-containing protein [Hymenobacter sediminis]
MKLVHLMTATAIGCTSCSLFEESGKTTVEGQVVDSATGQAVANAQVCLFANHRGGSSASYNPAGDWRPTDGEGKFSFSFEAEENNAYILRASSSRGDTEFQSAPRINGGRKNKGVQVPVAAMAWVRIHLLDVPPRTDAVNVAVWGFQDSFTLQPPLDTVIYRLVKASPNQLVLWQINGSRTEPATPHQVSSGVAGLDTMRVDIRY